MTTYYYKIEIACDNEEGEQFAAWLNARGHEAFVGSSTGNYVNGVWTSTDPDAQEIYNQLWDAYCDQ